MQPVANKSRPVLEDQSRRSRQPKWVLDALLSLIIAIPYALSILSGNVMSPLNISWLGGDPATYYIAWAMFRLGAGLHWPLTYTTALGYPLGDSISLLDPVPLMSLLLLPFSPILPTTFQYLGIYATICLALQLFFSVRLLRAIGVTTSLAVWAGGLLFLIAPSFTRRFGGHFALASHWLILAALLLYTTYTSDPLSLRRFRVLGAVLVFCAVGVNPYLAFIVLAVLTAAVVAAWITNLTTSQTAVVHLVVFLITAAVSAGAFGLIGEVREDFSASGYRHFSFNLLAPIDPAPAGSPVVPSHTTATSGQYEGYSYLGLGIITLIILLASSAATGQTRLQAFNVRRWIPLILASVVLTVLAMSTLVTFGSSVLVDLDPTQRLTPYLATFRASGRLFWLPYYSIILAAIAGTARCFTDQRASFILIMALLLQFWDTGPVRAQVRSALSAHEPPHALQSPVWKALKKQHRSLVVLPPWQCNADTPGGGDGYRMFGLFAAEQGLAINSYYAARYHRETMKYHCETSISDVLQNGFRPGVAYVVSKRLADRLATNGVKGGGCYSVDAFILCSATPLQLAQRSVSVAPELPAQVRAMVHQDEAYLETGWSAVEPGFGAWAIASEATIAYRPSSKPATSIRLTMIAIAGPAPVHFSVTSAGVTTDGTVPSRSKPSLQLFTLRVPVRNTPGAQRVIIRTERMLSPADQGYNADPRKLGIALHTIAADACPPSPELQMKTEESPDVACQLR